MALPLDGGAMDALSAARSDTGQAAAGPALDLTVDLGADIGSLRWWRGLGTLLSLSAGVAWIAQLDTASAPGSGLSAPVLPSSLLSPSVPVALPIAPPTQAGFAPASFGSLATGAHTGMTVPMTARVSRLSEIPERPIVTIFASLHRGESFDSFLRRQQVGSDDARAAAAGLAQVFTMKELEGTPKVEIVLGRRESRDVPRPLERVKFRANFGMNIAVAREGGKVVTHALPIRIDETPARVSLPVGRSLFVAARQAGVPGNVVSEFIKAFSYSVDFQREVGSGDRFDLIYERKVAETGEVRTGGLLYGALGLRREKAPLELVRFAPAGEKPQYFKADGVSVKRLLMSTPVDGARITSGFGLRLHPILGYSRMHKGMDFAAPTGTPVMAAGAGTVTAAGRHGGHGNYVRIEHQGRYATAYGHLDGFARGIRAGTRVAQGQVIGYVGSTGLSTGPHLHYEVYVNNQAVNPRDAKLPTGRWLEGKDLSGFKALLAKLRAVKIEHGSRAVIASVTDTPDTDA